MLVDKVIIINNRSNFTQVYYTSRSILGFLCFPNQVWNLRFILLSWLRFLVIFNVNNRKAFNEMFFSVALEYRFSTFVDSVFLFTNHHGNSRHAITDSLWSWPESNLSHLTCVSGRIEDAVLHCYEFNSLTLDLSTNGLLLSHWRTQNETRSVSKYVPTSSS